MRTETLRWGPSLLVGVGLLCGWQFVVTTYAIPPVILPSPLDVGAALLETYPQLLADAAVTAVTAGLGLAVGVVVGLGLAFAMTSSRAARDTILPYVVALRIAPVIAIAPLFFLWFGRGIPARALVVASLTLFPMTIATLDGLRSVPREYLDLARSVDAPSTRVFLSIRVPAAASSILAGAKIAATLAIVGAVVAEFVTLNAGIGYRVFETSSRLRTAETYAALVVLSLLGIAFYLLPSLVERAWRDA
ncbi:ABC transporter permease [Natronobeatus ordinarius]|uniref:ABC transporter permease n=1 Tax=Natronobeatus ordinarius TaxID=2963433 RepID=UPI003CE44D12